MDKMDMSLDQIRSISKPKAGGKSKAGKKFQSRTSPYQKPHANPGNSAKQWKHDKFAGGSKGVANGGVQKKGPQKQFKNPGTSQRVVTAQANGGDLRAQLQSRTGGTGSDSAGSMRSGNSGMVGIPNLIAPSGTIRFDDQGGITSQNASLFGGGMMIDRIGAMNNTGPGRVFAHATAGAFGNSPKANTISIKGAASTCALQIENLHPAATLEDVKASLTPYGKITDCMLVKDPQGRSTGTCIVTYERREAAMNVISQLNGQLADGRILKVAEVQSKLSIAGAAQKNATSPANQHIRATPGSMYSDRTASDLPASPLEQSPSFSSNNATSQRMFSSSPSPRGSILNRIGSGVKRKGKETADNTTFQVSI